MKPRRRVLIPAEHDAGKARLKGVAFDPAGNRKLIRVEPESRNIDRVVRAIQENRFYILSEEQWRDCANTRLDDVREGRNPTFAPPQV